MILIKREKFFIDSLKKDLFLPASLLYYFDLSKQSIVLDVGGYKGDWSMIISKMYSPKIFIFEPVSSFYESISKRFLGKENIKVYKFGLSGHSKELFINLDNDASSNYKNDSIYKEKILIEDIVDFLDKNNIKNIDLIKINIEGDEYDLLEKLIETGDINRCNNILVQFHDFVENASYRRNNIINQLNKTHNPVFSYPFIWELFKLK